MSVSVSIKRVVSVDAFMEEWAPDIREALRANVDLTASGMAHARRVIGDVRRQYGYTTDSWALLGKGKHNAKLAKNTMDTYSLTMSSFVHEMLNGRKVNMCPNAGSCVQTCVGKHGKGELSSVQKARAWRTEAFVSHPVEFAVLLRAELRWATRNWNQIALRLNVNSDIPWWLVAEDLFGDLAVNAYDYTKNEEVLPRGKHFTGSSWMTENYRLTFSYSERVARDRDLQKRVAGWRGHGGCIAVVTDRRKGEDVMRYMDLDEFNEHVPVISGDEDDYRFGDPSGCIVDLRMKGYAISRMPAIVQRVYADKV